MLAPSEQLMYSTVRIETILANNAGTSTGTGFFFDFLVDEAQGRSIPAIVTNKHVVANGNVGILHLHEHDGNSNPIEGKYLSVRVNDFAAGWIQHPDPDVDLCIWPIAGLLQQLVDQGKRPFRLTLDEALIPDQTLIEELMPLEEVVMIGYPNGIWDSVNNLPVFRRGITATKPSIKYNGKDEFLIDAAVFPGSSGSPVFLFNTGAYARRDGSTVIGNRIKLLGIVYAVFQHQANGNIVVQDIPTANVPFALTNIPNNLGLVIRAEKLKDFEPILKAQMGQANQL